MFKLADEGKMMAARMEKRKKQLGLVKDSFDFSDNKPKIGRHSF